MPTLRDRVRGMFLGTAIGDALGMPVETFKPEDIAKKYPETNGRVTDYLVPTGHKWFDGTPAGSTTDDWQLTAVVARALMQAPLDMDEQLKGHVAAYEKSDKGWGGTTRRAVRAAANNVPWSKSGEFMDGRGRGNGVVMKLAPVVVYHRVRVMRQEYDENVYRFLCDLTAMTHRTKLALTASMAHFCALYFCLVSEHSGDKLRDLFARFTFIDIQSSVKRFYEHYDELPEDEHDIMERLHALGDWRSFDYSDPTQLFGGGTSYVYSSLPFTYAYFLKDPDSIESLYDCVSAGGDADSNGSMLAAMLGARFGASVFPRRLIDGLQNHPEVLTLADDFCDTFDIRD